MSAAIEMGSKARQVPNKPGGDWEDDRLGRLGGGRLQ